MTIQDVFEAVGARAAGKMTDEDVHELECVACPGAGACGGQFTANTMALVIDFLGISPARPLRHPGDAPDKPEAAVEAGEIVMELVRYDTRPSEILTREAFENAIAAVAGTGGSTNGVLHLLAIAREAGVPLELDDFDTIAGADADRRRPQAVRPLRRHRPARGRRRRPRRARARRRGPRPRRRARRRRPHARARSPPAVVERPGQDVVVSCDTPIKPTGGLAILRGSLAPEGWVVKLAGHERLLHAARRASSTPRRTASPPSRRARSSPATWS